MTPPARARLVAVVVLTLLVDAASKLATLRWLGDGRTVDLGLVDLRLVRNTGVAFSMGADLPVAVVAGVTAVLMAGFAVAAWRGHLGGAVAAGLIVGGGVGNLVDRIVRGSVVDMIDVGSFPVFNLADVALNVGVGLLLIHALRGSREADAADGAEPRAEDEGDVVGAGHGYGRG